MTRDDVLTTLQAHKQELRDRFGVMEIALFGSFARGQATEESDIDLLVQFDGPATADGYFGVLFLIEDLFGRNVDLVTHKALREEFRPYVEKDAVYV